MEHGHGDALFEGTAPFFLTFMHGTSCEDRLHCSLAEWTSVLYVGHQFDVAHICVLSNGALVEFVRKLDRARLMDRREMCRLSNYMWI